VTLLVVDASVVIKWFVPEGDRAAALELRAAGAGFAVPDLMFVESANILWKLVRREEIEPQRAIEVIDGIVAAPFVTHTNESLARDAMDLAIATGLSAYDASYVALAIRLNTRCITADQRLARKLAGTPSATHVSLLADYAN
jgi:predicted nucleic acid-binding protein